MAPYGFYLVFGVFEDMAETFLFGKTAL